jgi:uncharacterized protein (DUF1810 family)
VKAQGADDAGYRSALDEIQHGHKRSHWIWYVFPQLTGLGQSPIARTYGIAGREEALAYLRHDVLRDRLLEITTAVADGLRKGIPLTTLMGSAIDAKKLVSSMTLFREVATTLDEEIAHAANDVLDQARAQGYAPCEYTLTALTRSR